MTRSFRGKEVNMLKLFKKNETKIALGNSHMNARGDIIGRGGVVLKSREDQIKEYEESVKQQEGQVSMKKPEEMTDLEKTLKKYVKPEKVIPTKKKKVVEEPKEEPKKEEKQPEIIYDEEE